MLRNLGVGAEVKQEWEGWAMPGTGSSTYEHPAPDVRDKRKQGETPVVREQGVHTVMEGRVGE